MDVPLRPTLVRVRKPRHQLKGGDMGKQAEPLLLTHFDGIDEEKLQQEEIQVVEHI